MKDDSRQVYGCEAGLREESNRDRIDGRPAHHRAEHNLVSMRANSVWLANALLQRRGYLERR